MLGCRHSNLDSHFSVAITPNFWNAKILIQSKCQENLFKVDVPSCWVLGQVVWPTAILNLQFFSLWNTLLNSFFIHENTYPCSTFKHLVAWPRHHVVLSFLLLCWSISGVNMETWKLEPCHKSSASKTIWHSSTCSASSIRTATFFFILPFQLHTTIQCGKQFSVARWWDRRKKRKRKRQEHKLLCVALCDWVQNVVFPSC